MKYKYNNPKHLRNFFPLLNAQNFLQVQQNNYASFYDDRNENWSINFDSEAALYELTKQVRIVNMKILVRIKPFDKQYVRICFGKFITICIENH